MQTAIVDRPVDGLTTQQIEAVVCQFGDAARRAEQAGYDGVQIHAAHFFYLSKFISPLINHRADRYGGDQQGGADASSARYWRTCVLKLPVQRYDILPTLHRKRLTNDALAKASDGFARVKREAYPHLHGQIYYFCASWASVDSRVGMFKSAGGKTVCKITYFKITCATIQIVTAP